MRFVGTHPNGKISLWSNSEICHMEFTVSSPRPVVEDSPLTKVPNESTRPLGALLATPVHTPKPANAATWPSACTVKGIPAVDDF
jgi:hypothetical protein